MRFLIDEDADARVAGILRSRGHVVEHSRDILGRAATDSLVAAAAARLSTIAADRRGAVIITRNWKHFRRLIRRQAVGEQTPYPSVGLIAFHQCRDSSALRRIGELIEIIEAEYAIVQSLPDPRLIVEIGETVLRIIR